MLSPFKSHTYRGGNYEGALPSTLAFICLTCCCARGWDIRQRPNLYRHPALLLWAHGYCEHRAQHPYREISLGVAVDAESMSLRSVLFRLLVLAPRRSLISHRFSSLTQSPPNSRRRGCCQCKPTSSRLHLRCISSGARSGWSHWLLKRTTSLCRSKMSTRSFFIRAQQKSLSPSFFFALTRGD